MEGSESFYVKPLMRHAQADSGPYGVWGLYGIIQEIGENRFSAPELIREPFESP